MMAVIGEQFEEFGDHICGAVVNIRQKGDKVALWTRDAQADDVNTRIGSLISELAQNLSKEIQVIS
jgi:translation initiation factor 4E